MENMVAICFRSLNQVVSVSAQHIYVMYCSVVINDKILEWLTLPNGVAS